LMGTLWRNSMICRIPRIVRSSQEESTNKN
jgi:hypothetical protein